MSDTLAIFPALKTPRLALAPLGLADAEPFRVLTDHPAITSGIDFLHAPVTLADAVALIHGAGDGRDRFIGIRHGAALVGVVGAHLHGDDKIEIGYWIGPAWHGKGFATEATRAVLAELGTRFPARRILAECRPDNRASWRVLEKLGFVPSGDAGARPGRRVLVLAG